MSMTVQDFVAAERQRIIDFYEMWTLEHRTNPEGFPLDLEYIDWVEQYQAWEGRS